MTQIPLPVYVVNASSGGSGVTSFNTRTGAVTLADTDIESTFSNAGDLYTGTGVGAGEILPVGTAGQVLTVGGSDPSGLEWAAPSTTGILTDSGSLSAYFDLTSTYTTVLTTGNLAVGLWLITSILQLDSYASGTIASMQIIGGSATATFTGTAAQNITKTTVWMTLSCNCFANITSAGTLLIQALGVSGSDYITNLTADNAGPASGYTAIKVG